jgi:hypothetical protein
MNNYKIVGSFHISPSIKQINNNKYTLNLEKVFSNIQTYIKFNSLIYLPIKNNIISYIVPDYNIKLYNKNPCYLLSRIKNVKIMIYYTEKYLNNKTTVSFSSNKESITLKKKKKLKFLSFDQHITLSSTQKISKIVISGLLLDGYNNFSNFCLDEKKLLRDIFFWFSNSHIFSINKLIEIIQTRSNLTQEEKINLIRSEMLGTTNDFINSGIINEVCNKLEKII